MKRKPFLRWFLAFLALVVILAGAGARWFYNDSFAMPGQSFRGTLPAQTPQQSQIEKVLRADVEYLAKQLGPRNIWHDENYQKAADYIQKQFELAGYKPRRQSFPVQDQTCHNIEVELHGVGKTDEIVIIGAHYDTVLKSPGANDNASGVAALLAIARALHGTQPTRTLRLVAFANEENPVAKMPDAMGSRVYAARCRDFAENIVAMIAFDGLGYYSDKPDSQHYPAPFNLLFPSTANFVGFVGDSDSEHLVRQCVGAFRRSEQFPSEGIAASRQYADIGRSDHESFWNQHYHAIMVTDTLPFRYDHYHKPTDTSDKIDFEKLARVTEGLTAVARDLAGVPDVDTAKTQGR